jgi:cytochrome c oxidase cbb3-type subunit 3
MNRELLRLSLWIALAYAGLAGMPTRSRAQQFGKASEDRSAAEGKQIFATTCAACHGLDGNGGEHGPDISRRREVQSLPDKALLQIVREGVPGTRMPAFGSLGDAPIEAVVRYLRILQGQMVATPLPGNRNNGKVLFFGKAGCSQCHMANGQGGFMGSDLTTFANTQSLAQTRSAITDPNRNLDPRKRTVIVKTSDGQTLTGLARNEDNFSLQLQTTDGAFHLLNKSDVQKIEYQPRSLMPDDYGSQLSSKELDDLVSYLVSIAQKQSQDPDRGKDKNNPDAEQE